MAINLNRVKLSAEAHAALKGYNSAESVPPEEQAATAQQVAQAMDLPLGEVLGALRKSVWAGTGDITHRNLTGAKHTQASSTQQRKTQSDGLPPHMVIVGGYSNDAAAMVKPSKVFEQATGKEVSRIFAEQPYNFAQTIVDRAAQVDGCLSGKEGGEITKDLPQEVLDMPVFRGMSGAGFNAASLCLLGYVIPEGSSQDYAGFKTSTHKGGNIDATEWSLDPYIALKSTKGRGYMIQSTLGELLEQGAHITRFAKDTEGGFFVTGAIQPTAKGVSNEGDHYYVSDPIRPPDNEAARKAAKHLQSNLSRSGGWRGFLNQDTKLAVALNKQGLGEAKTQLHFFLSKLGQHKEAEGIAKTIKTRLRGLDPKMDLVSARKSVNKLLQRVQMELAVRQDDGPNY